MKALLNPRVTVALYIALLLCMPVTACSAAEGSTGDSSDIEELAGGLLPSEDTQNDAPQYYDSDSKAFREVLLENGFVFDATDGRNKTVQDMLLDWEELTSIPERRFETEIVNFTVVDLYGDGSQAVVLGVQATIHQEVTYYLALDFVDGIVHAFRLTAGRCFRELKVNGMFNGSGGAGVFYINRVRYTGLADGIGYEILCLASEQPARTEDGSYEYVHNSDLNWDSVLCIYTANGEPSTEEEYLEFCREYYGTPDVVWYDFNTENLKLLLP